jgi:hypothetical protein
LNDEQIIDQQRRVEIPLEIDEESKFGPGQRIRLRKLPNGDLVLEQVTDLLDLAGLLHYKGPAHTVEEMNEGIEKEVASQYLRSIQTS